MGHEREPIPNTCPKIDKFISSIQRAMVSRNAIQNSSYEELLSIASSLNDELSSCVDYLEEMRTSNDKLRTWGSGEADKVDEMKAEISSLEDTVSELDGKIDELKSLIKTFPTRDLTCEDDEPSIEIINSRDRIWLQVDDDAVTLCDYVESDGKKIYNYLELMGIDKTFRHEETTWANEKINDNDIEYIRADIIHEIQDKLQEIVE